MQQTISLPDGFQDLTSLVDEWGALESSDERYLRRTQLPMDRLQAYYDLVQSRLDDIFKHLDSFPFGQSLPEPEALLLRVTMAMAEVAQAIEVYGQPDVPNLPPGYTATVSPIRRG